MSASVVTTKRPAWVPAPFAGRCKLFPVRDAMLLPYQRDWVMDACRKRICEKSRQIGFTWATAYDLVRDKGSRGNQRDAWITSRDEMQARLFILDLKNWGALLKIGAEDQGETFFDGDRQRSAFTLAFASGATAYSLSSSPDAQAGKRGDRVADEFALHKDPRLLYSIMQPGITWGGKMSIFSTHRGSHNFFNKLIEEARHGGNPKGFSLHRVTLQDALDQGFLYKLQSKLPADDERQGYDETDYFNAVRAECADEESFLQEFCCVPADDNAAFLSYDLIAGCEYALTEQWRHPLAELAKARNPLFVGVDVGRDHDLTVIWVIERDGGVLHTREVVTMQRETFDAQEDTLYQILALPGVRRCCIDATGLGKQFAERAQKRFGTYRVEAVTFTGPVKADLAYPVRSACEDRSLRIPNDKLIRADLRAIRKETTAAGNIRFTADRGVNGHADRFWALALAVHAGKDVSGPFHASPVSRDRFNRRRGAV